MISKWVIWGANGFIGKHAHQKLSLKYPCVQVSRKNDSLLSVIDEIGRTTNIENSELGFLEIISTYKPDYLLNCAAIASVEECAKNPTRAQDSNVFLPSMLATSCRVNNIKFIHISTDAVFGQGGRFFQERQIPEPISNYAKTKYKAESMVMELDPTALIVRTRPLGESTRRTTLLDFFIDNLLSGIRVDGHVNVYFTPIFIVDLIASIEKLAISESAGIWHVTGSERMSKFDVGVLVAEALNINHNLISPVEFKNQNISTARNLDTSLSNAKYTDIFGAVPSVRNGIKDVLKRH